DDLPSPAFPRSGVARQPSEWLVRLVRQAGGIAGRAIAERRPVVINGQSIVSPADWLQARKELLAREKSFTKARDGLSQARRALPWERVEKGYAFEGPDGRESLADLFAGRSQLIVYHFMFAPDWEAGCKSCSFWADNFNGVAAHLRQRDTQFVAVSRAPLDKLEAFKTRMGWDFKWVSSGDTDFNYDYGVSIRQGGPAKAK